MPQNPEYIEFEGQERHLSTLLEEYCQLREQVSSLTQKQRKALRQYRREHELKPYQAELIRLQQYLEDRQQRMIILFEGRDAAGKSGVIRRVTRCMNERHYRVVALGRPTEEQRTQWYFQKYVAQFPRGGEIVLFDRSWYNRAMVEPVFGFCTDEEYKNFIRGVVGFEKDLGRQGTVLLKMYFSVTREEQARENLNAWKRNSLKRTNSPVFRQL